MTAGEPLSASEWAWITFACMTPCPDFDIAQKFLFREADKNIGPEIDKFGEDLLLFLDLETKPEDEWSRYEKRRMRKLLDRLHAMAQR
jgi:hypothetical protein